MKNDWRREWRGREVLGLMLPFALTLGLSLNFTFSLAFEQRTLPAIGALWTALLFSTILGLGRSFALEQENGVWEGLVNSPVDAGVIFSAKLISNLSLLVVLDAVVVPLFAALYNILLFSPGTLASIALGTAALGAAGTLLVPLAGQTRVREILLPVLLLPLLVPVMIGAVQSTVMSIPLQTNTLSSQGEQGAQPPWLGLLAACTALFVGAGYLLYGQLLDE